MLVTGGVNYIGARVKLIAAFEQASGVPIARKIASRRGGALTAFWALGNIVNEHLG